MSEQKVPWSVEQRFVIKFLVGENVPSAEIHHRLQQQYGEEYLRRRHSSPYCCWSLWWISADGSFSPTRNLITMRCSTLRGTFCSLITLATARQDWTGSNPNRREGGGCGFTLWRSHSCCAVRLVYTQISPGHIWTTLYNHVHSHQSEFEQLIISTFSDCTKLSGVASFQKAHSKTQEIVISSLFFTLTLPYGFTIHIEL